jgi:hypothetical protein
VVWIRAGLVAITRAITAFISKSMS